MLARFILARGCSAPTLDKVLVEIAAKETDITVKHALAEREKNPTQVWEILAADKDSRVWDFLRKNKNTPEEILEKLPAVQIKAKRYCFISP